MAEIRFEHVWKRYGNVEAVKDLNLKCENGEFLALLGPSGCGKTSSLRMLAGLEVISEGDLYIGDNRVNDIPPKDRDISMVFEDYALYPHMSVYNNIAFPLKIRDFERSEIDQRVQRTLTMLGLKELRDENVQRLSGGAQQRISIGRAIVREPQVLLMDEPISHLDSAHKVELRGELKRLQRNLGVTTVYVTHDQIEAIALADRVAVMNLGVLQQLGPPEELYDRPANLFVAGFIGEPPMNFIPCEVDSVGRSLKGVDFSIPVSQVFLESLSGRGVNRLVLGIRPANLKIQKAPSNGLPRAKVYSIEPRGDSAVVMVEMGSHRLLSESPVNLDLQEDVVVGLSFPEEQIHVFEAEGGTRMTTGLGRALSRTMGAVGLENVWKSFGRVEALKGVDLQFESGGLTVLLGHSGAGKTTILRMIAGLETVDRGVIRINDRVVNDEPPRSRGTSMAFESYALYPQLSVFENMTFSFMVAAGSKRTLTEEVRSRVRAMAELLEIDQLLDRLPRQLSGGQRQRVALGRTLVRDAVVHLLDEPIAHLDAKLRHQLRGGLKHLQRDRGATTVWTTPDQLEAMSIADQVAVMNRGVLEQLGSPSELYQHPKNEYVARSLGEPPMNILPSSVRRANGEMQLEINGISLPVRGESARVLAQSNGDGRISMGIRPTDISVQAERPRDPSLESEVVVFEPLGQYGVVTVQCAGEELKVKVDKGIHPEPGARIWLVPHADRYHFFNPRTGEALRA